jgi:cytochrome c553
MKKGILSQLLLGAFLTGLAATATAAGDASAGETKAIPCLGCHGIPGYFNVYPTYHVPRVGGQHAQYIVDALKAYKSGARGHRTMRAQAASLTEQDMADIAAYFAAATND